VQAAGVESIAERAPCEARRTRFWPAIALILLAAAGLRVGYVLTVTRHDMHFYDAAYYQLQAEAIADGKGFFVNPLVQLAKDRATAPAAADHEPVTTLALVPAAFIDDREGSHLAMRFTMTLIGLGTVVVLGLLGRAVGGSTVGVVAAGIAALYPNLWMNDGILMSESITILLTAAILLCVYRTLDRGSWPWIAGLGALSGLLALTHSELALLAPFLVAPAVWIGASRAGADTRARVARVAGCAAVALVVVAPWVGYNLSRFDKPTFFSTGEGDALIQANCPSAYSGRLLGSSDFACLSPGFRDDPSVLNAKNRSRAFDFIAHHLDRLPVVIAARVGRMWSVFRIDQTVGFEGNEGRARWASYAGIATLYLVVPFAIAGGVVLRRRRVPLWPLVTPIVVVTATRVLAAGAPRYRAAAEPSLVVLAAVGAVALTTWLRRGGFRARPSAGSSDRLDEWSATEIGQVRDLAQQIFVG
jgi:hypothetical protein